MQRRYCSCGQVIWAQYFQAKGDWVCQLGPRPYAPKGLRFCPTCGRPLNIDRLP